MILLRHLFSEV